MRRWVLVVLVMGLASTASARTIEVGVGTTVPLDVGVRLRLDLPAGFFVQGSFGYQPRSYLAFANDIIVDFGGYSRSTADLVEATLDDALVLRATFGWSPLFGLEIFGGYTVIALGGNLSSRATIELLTGRQLPAQLDPLLPLSSTVHALHAGIGWGPTFGPIRLRFSFELITAVASTSSIDLEPTSTLDQTVIDDGSRVLDDYLDGIFSGDYFIPALGFDVFVGF